MMKKAKTLIERFGFKDKDMLEPLHDEMLCWLLEPKNCETMLNELNLVKLFHSICCRLFFARSHAQGESRSAWRGYRLVS